jgi:hypothetical protein
VGQEHVVGPPRHPRFSRSPIATAAHHQGRTPASLPQPPYRWTTGERFPSLTRASREVNWQLIVAWRWLRSSSTARTRCCKAAVSGTGERDSRAGTRLLYMMPKPGSAPPYARLTLTNKIKLTITEERFHQIKHAADDPLALTPWVKTTSASHRRWCLLHARVWPELMNQSMIGATLSYTLR